MPHRRLRPALLLPLACAACGPASSEPRPGAGPDVALTFGVHRIATLPAFSVARVDAGSVLVRGTFGTPCSPYGAAAAAARAADTVVLRVEGRAPGACRAAVGAVAYDARLGALPAGAFVLRVVHRGEAGTPGERDAFVTTVTTANP